MRSIATKALVSASAVFLLLGLAACAAPVEETTNDDSTSEQQEDALVAGDGIPGAEDIVVRYQKLEGNSGIWLYCVDQLAYMGSGTGFIPSPQYDLLCSVKR